MVLQSSDISDNPHQSIKIFLVTRGAKRTNEEELVIKYLKFIEECNGKDFKLPKFMSESPNDMALKDEKALKIIFVIKNQQNPLHDDIKNLSTHTIFRLNEIISKKNITLVLYKNDKNDAISDKDFFTLMMNVRDAMFVLTEKKKKFILRQ